MPEIKEAWPRSRYMGRFPPPAEYVTDIEDYLGQVANGQQHDCATRVKAASDLGVFGGLRLAQRIQLALQLKLAYEDALVRYAKRFPPAPPRDDE